MVIIETRGTEEVNRMLKSLGSIVRDLRPFFRDAKMILMREVHENFAAGGRPEWAPLSPTTLELKAKGRNRFKTYSQGRITKTTANFMASAKPLMDTGLLRASVGVPSKDGILDMSASRLRLGTAIVYAAAQNFGKTNGPRPNWIPGARIPARPFMVVSREGEGKLVRALEDRVRSIAK